MLFQNFNILYSRFFLMGSILFILTVVTSMSLSCIFLQNYVTVHLLPNNSASISQSPIKF